ncbi:MAG: FMN-dependent NADH-azoreductase [Chlamydiia bacterium]
MTKLLYIEASPRKERSSSIQVAKVFLDEWKRLHAGDEVVTLDLWKTDMPPFDGEIIEAKYAILHGKKPTPEQAKAWRVIEEFIREFKSADKYVFSVPMWNYSIPYKLTHYLNIIVQPTYTFNAKADGSYEGLVVGKKALLVYARGGDYSPGSGADALDMQSKYMDLVLGFIGFKDIQSIMVEPTIAPKEIKEKALQKAMDQAKRAAVDF